jgi:hypothetical protein
MTWIETIYILILKLPWTLIKLLLLKILVLIIIDVQLLTNTIIIRLIILA